ncbi:MAG: FAD-dependent monooxygenase [Candidatus Puniceispirillaceae bacterium]
MDNEIAISGTGIAGLAAATAVIAADRDCVLFGPPAQMMRGGVQLAPNGWAALSVLGLAQDVLSRATRLHEITVRSLTNNATLARLPLKDVYASVARADLATVFEQKIGQTDRFRQHNTTVEQASQTEDGVAIIGKDAGLHHVAGLVAADGVTGFGRAFISGQSETAIRASLATDKVALRSTIHLSDLPNFFSQAVSNLWLGDGVHIVHYPIGDSANIVATMPKTLAHSEWQGRLFRHNTPLQFLADPAIKWTSTPLPRSSTGICWRRGTMVLAGDAAHVMPPHLAQGAGQSLQDAACLMQSLTQHADVSSAFAAYARHRSGAVAKIAQKADISGKIMAFSGLAGKLRNAALDLGGNHLMQDWLAEVWAADPGLRSQNT